MFYLGKKMHSAILLHLCEDCLFHPPVNVNMILFGVFLSYYVLIPQMSRKNRLV